MKTPKTTIRPHRKTQMTHILTDCDGVLLDWNTAFDKYMLLEHGAEVLNDYTYCIGTRYGWRPEAGIAEVLKFNSTKAVHDLDPIPGAVEAMKVLNEAYGCRFTVVSSLSDDPKKRDARENNLVDVFGNVFDDVICLKLTRTKADVLREYPRGTVWLEDHAANAAIGHALGLRSHLLAHNYNRDEATELLVENKIDGYHNNWSEMLLAIIKDIEK